MAEFKPVWILLAWKSGANSGPIIMGVETKSLERARKKAKLRAKSMVSLS